MDAMYLLCFVMWRLIILFDFSELFCFYSFSPIHSNRAKIYQQIREKYLHSNGIFVCSWTGERQAQTRKNKNCILLQ